MIGKGKLFYVSVIFDREGVAVYVNKIFPWIF